MRGRPEALPGKGTVLAEGDWQHLQPRMSAQEAPCQTTSLNDAVLQTFTANIIDW